jgi:hypothetical protein
VEKRQDYAEDVGCRQEAERSSRQSRRGRRWEQKYAGAELETGRRQEQK